jgi:hypothetical protein
MSSLCGTSNLNNLSSPEARGSVGTVAQEEAINKIAPPIKTNIDRNFTITHLLMIYASNFPSSPPQVQRVEELERIV